MRNHANGQKRKLPSISKHRKSYDRKRDWRNNKSSSKRFGKKKNASSEYIKIKDSYDKNDLILEGLHNAIHEYFIKRNFLDTVDVFQKEIVDQETSVPKQNYDSTLLEVSAFFSLN